jgi:hypothetical protein
MTFTFAIMYDCYDFCTLSFRLPGDYWNCHVPERPSVCQQFAIADKGDSAREGQRNRRSLVEGHYRHLSSTLVALTVIFGGGIIKPRVSVETSESKSSSKKDQS